MLDGCVSGGQAREAEGMMVRPRKRRKVKCESWERRGAVGVSHDAGTAQPCARAGARHEPGRRPSCED